MGFIGEVQEDGHERPYVDFRAIHNIDWNARLASDSQGMPTYDDLEPLLERVMDLNKRLYDLATAAEERQSENFRSLLGATGEMLGVLAQALGSSDWEPPSGLALVQLKRALRGAAFAFGMLFPRRAAGLLGPAEFEEFANTIQSLQTDTYAELAHLREAREPE